MYMVVSQWEPLPGHEAQFFEKGRTMRAFLRSVPGVQMIESFKSDEGRIIVIHGYADHATYDRIVNDPNGEFVRKLKEVGIEHDARWIHSYRGETVDSVASSDRATVR